MPENRHPPTNHPWIIGILPIGDNTIQRLQFHCPWPHPLHNGIKIVKVQWHAFPMVKISWNTTTIQFPMGTWIYQPCILPKQTSCPPTSRTCALTIFITDQNKQFTHPMRQIYIPGDIPTLWNLGPFFNHFFPSLFFLIILCANY